MKHLYPSAVMSTALFLVSFTSAGRAKTAYAAADVHVDLGFRAGDADVDFFYDALAPHGDWIEMAPYGWVWAPRSVTPDWRPYRDGHWVYTDYGWTWVADEEWGWAPYHYGRWALDSRFGWVWVPGSVWAPAWVSWRWGDGYAGWAPLPPEADITVGSARFGIDPLAYTFVEERHLAEPVLVGHFVPPARNVTLVNVTRNVTNYTVVENRVVNRGVKVDEVERAAGHGVPRARLAEAKEPAPTRVRGNEVAIYKPPVPKATGRLTRPTRAQAKGPAAPAPAPKPPDVRDLPQRQEEQQQRLAQEQQKERQELQRAHEQEKTSPPPSVSRQELEARQKAEQQAQAQHEEREKKLLADRQARERQPADGQKAQHREEKPPPQPPPPRKPAEEKPKPEKDKQQKDKPKEEKPQER
jgi:hypothetical protein